ncbi:MAG: WG repeat-containing protein [Firmicutes bacterium]|nr:WG repeat-containing protein [Bacillota bacterium]
MRYQLDTDKYVMMSCQDVHWFFSTYKIEQRRIADIRPTSLDYMIRNLDEVDDPFGGSYQCSISTDGTIAVLFEDGDLLEIEKVGESAIVLGFNSLRISDLPAYTGHIYKLSTMFHGCVGKLISAVEFETAMGVPLFPRYRDIDFSHENNHVTSIKLRLEDGTCLDFSGWLDFYELDYVDPDGKPMEISGVDLLSDLSNEGLSEWRLQRKKCQWEQVRLEKKRREPYRESWRKRFLTTSEEVQPLIESFHLVGRTVRYIVAVGYGYTWSESDRDELIYGKYLELPQEEFEKIDQDIDLPAGVMLDRYVELDEPILLVFDDGDVLAMELVGQGVACVGLNTLSVDTKPYINQRNFCANELFHDIIGRTITSVEVCDNGEGKIAEFKLNFHDKTEGEDRTLSVYADWEDFFYAQLENGRGEAIKIECSAARNVLVGYTEFEDDGVEHACKVRKAVENMQAYSLIDIDRLDLAYYTENWGIAGIWGYDSCNSAERIRPQYIFAEDFENGTAIVCKGAWKRDLKWYNAYRIDGLWSDDMLWGMIDTHGQEVIPFQYGGIKRMDRLAAYAVDTCVWKDGKWHDGMWALIDQQGNFLTPAEFEEIDGFCSKNGYFTFGKIDPSRREDLDRYGIYSLRHKKALFEAKFTEVDYIDIGESTFFQVECLEADGQLIHKILDSNGGEVTKKQWEALGEEAYIRSPVYSFVNGIRRK